MNYNKVYDQLVNKVHQFIDGEYSEVHHKIPRSLGGSDDDNNLVRLTAREHYIAHLLLVKIHQENPSAHGKMLYAFNCMRWGRVDGDRSFKFNSRLYQALKKQYSQLRKERMPFDSPSLGKIWIHSVELKKSILWEKTQPIPDGWNIGRVMNWDSYLQRKLTNEERVSQLKLKFNKNIELYTNMYNDYLECGLPYVRKKYNYDKSQENLGMLFKRYVKEYDKTALRKATNRCTNKDDRYNECTKMMSVEQKIEYFTEVYNFYKINGFKDTASKFNWTKTRNSLVFNFRTYVKDYVPITKK